MQINKSNVEGLCEDLDRQVTEFEAAAESLEDKVQVLEAEKRELVSKVDLVQVLIRGQRLNWENKTLLSTGVMIFRENIHPCR